MSKIIETIFNESELTEYYLYSCYKFKTLTGFLEDPPNELKEDKRYRDMNKEISNFKNSEENKNKSNWEVTIIFGKGKRKNILLFLNKNLPFSKFFIG